jgi:hypothetical protein
VERKTLSYLFIFFFFDQSPNLDHRPCAKSAQDALSGVAVPNGPFTGAGRRLGSVLSERCSSEVLRGWMDSSSSFAIVFSLNTDLG